MEEKEVKMIRRKEWERRWELYYLFFIFTVALLQSEDAKMQRPVAAMKGRAMGLISLSIQIISVSPKGRRGYPRGVTLRSTLRCIGVAAKLPISEISHVLKPEESVGSQREALYHRFAAREE